MPRAWLFLAAAAAVVLAHQPARVTAQLGQAAVEPEQAPASETLVAEVQRLFPKTRGWFGIVADARFERAAEGALTPDFSVLKHTRVRAVDGAGYTVSPVFPSSYTRATRIASSADRLHYYIELSPLGANDVAAEVQAGLIVYPGAFPDVDLLYKSTPTHVDEYMLLRTAAAARSFSYRVTLGPGIERLREAGSGVEAVDARERPWLRASTPWAMDQSGRRVTGQLRVHGDVLTVELPLAELTPPILVDPDWKSTGDMAYGRFYHRVNMLPDGRLLATGGCSASVCSGDLTVGSCRTPVRAIEALDLGTKTFSTVANSGETRFFHVAELVDGNNVLIAGGCAAPPCKVTSSAELLDPQEGSVTPIDPLPVALAGQASAVLSDGRVLIAGGCTSTESSGRTFLYSPAQRSFEEVAPMHEGRCRAGLSQLRGGGVLLSGGCTTIECADVLASAELYDPQTDSWQSLPPMASARGGHYSAALRDGRVLIGGGCADQRCSQVLSDTELFDPKSARFSASASGLRARFGAVAVPLPDGNALVSQGCQTRDDCDLSNELYDAKQQSFAMLEPAVTTRAFHGVVVTPDNIVIANGGCQPTTCSWWNEYYKLTLATHEVRDAGVDASVQLGTGAEQSSGCACSSAGPRRSLDVVGWGSTLLSLVIWRRLRRRRGGRSNL